MAAVQDFLVQKLGLLQPQDTGWMQGMGGLISVGDSKALWALESS